MFVSPDVAVRRGVVTEHVRGMRLQELVRGIDAVNSAHPTQILKVRDGEGRGRGGQDRDRHQQRTEAKDGSIGSIRAQARIGRERTGRVFTLAQRVSCSDCFHDLRFNKPF